MNLFFSKPFIRDYRNLPKQIQMAIDKQNRVFIVQPRTFFFKHKENE